MDTIKLLVTGASGLAGAAIVREFGRQNIPVRALVRNKTKVSLPDLLCNVTYMEGDMLKPDSLYSALEGVERALLISSSNEYMVETQCSFIDACKSAGISHVIKFSGEESQIGYNPDNFRYTREHNEIETYLENSGLSWTHIRPSQFMQVYLREAISIRERGELCLPLEQIKMSPVALEDIAKVAVALMDKGGHERESLRMTGPEALSMPEIAVIIEKMTGRSVRYINTPWEQRRKTLLAAGLPKYLVNAIGEQTAERCRHPDAYVDLTTHHLFGVRPTYFEDFVSRHAEVFGKAELHHVI